MRTGVVLVTHGDAALSMVQAVERMVGALNLETVSVRIGEPAAETEERIEAAVNRQQASQLLFMVDLEGSTPFNLCCRRCGGHSVVLSGVNLAMLFKLSTADREQGAEALAQELMATGLKSIHIRPTHQH